VGQVIDSPAVWASHLRKRYKRRTAVDGVSFTVGRGVVLGRLGPNGAWSARTPGR
jgi:ABC-2 type transport system ATP-binding protein